MSARPGTPFDPRASYPSSGAGKRPFSINLGNRAAQPLNPSNKLAAVPVPNLPDRRTSYTTPPRPPPTQQPYQKRISHLADSQRREVSADSFASAATAVESSSNQPGMSTADPLKRGRTYVARRNQEKRREPSVASSTSTLRSDTTSGKTDLKWSKSADSIGSTGLPPSRLPHRPALQRLGRTLQTLRPPRTWGRTSQRQLSRESGLSQIRTSMNPTRTYRPFHVSKSHKGKRRYKCELCPHLSKVTLKVFRENKEHPWRSLEVHRFFSLHQLVEHSIACKCDDRSHFFKHHAVSGGITEMHKHLARIHQARCSWDSWRTFFEDEIKALSDARKQIFPHLAGLKFDKAERRWQSMCYNALQRDWSTAEKELPPLLPSQAAQEADSSRPSAPAKL